MLAKRRKLNGSMFMRQANQANFRQRIHHHFGAAILVSGSMLLSSALAHQTFLLPDQFVWSINEPVEVILTSALSFPNVEHGPTKDRIEYSHVDVGGETVDELNFTESETALSISFSPTRSGLAVIAASSKPRAGEIAPDDVDMYLDEIEADKSTREAFDELPGSPALNRSYSKHAKTYICIETCAGENHAAMPVGQKLEFVSANFENNSYRLLLDGEPLSGQSVTITPVDGESVKIDTDENGTFKIIETLSGVVMVSAVWITLPEQPGGVYHSDYATLTVDLDQAR